MLSLMGRFWCHHTKLLCWENHPYVGTTQRVAVLIGITENSESVSYKVHKFRLFTSKQLKLGYVSEREIDPFQLVNHVVQNFYAGEQ